MIDTITTVPWGGDEGLPVLLLRGDVETPRAADALVAELEQRYAPLRSLAGVVVELGRPGSQASQALLIGLASSSLWPVRVYGRPGSEWPSAAVEVGLDVSEFFGGLPEHVPTWADGLHEAAQRCPAVAELLVRTEVAPTAEMLAHASGAFAPAGAFLHVPGRVAEAATLAAARCGYAWHVRVRPDA